MKIAAVIAAFLFPLIAWGQYNTGIVYPQRGVNFTPNSCGSGEFINGISNSGAVSCGIPSGGGTGNWFTGSGTPSGGADGDFYLDLDTANIWLNTLGTWAISGTMYGTDGGYVGYSTRFGSSINTTTLKGTVEYILQLGYVNPTISLTAVPSCGSIYENGATSPGSGNIVLTAHVGFTADPIVNAKFYDGASLIDTETGNPPVPSGGNVSYTDASPGFTSTTTYTATTTDTHPTTITSNNCTYNFVYPYYYGTYAVSGATGAQIRANLTDLVIANTANVTKAFSASSNYIYFAYPSAYPVLTSIFEGAVNVIGSFSVSTVSITGLDSTSQSYRVYQSGLTSYVGNVEFEQ